MTNIKFKEDIVEHITKVIESDLKELETIKLIENPPLEVKANILGLSSKIRNNLYRVEKMKKEIHDYYTLGDSFLDIPKKSERI